jgi:hypothetical protein
MVQGLKNEKIVQGRKKDLEKFEFEGGNMHKN